ncbi:hypothetical protein OQA88_5919 [Cercophora sp. LCS_1]
MSTTLDHIVILVAPETLANLPPWLTSSFTIINGGRHSNGITENKLILFQDGVYIELIAFVRGTPPQDRASTRWGRRDEGEIVDFALTLLSPKGEDGFNPEDSFRQHVQERVREAQTGLEYSNPIAGGRVTPDGTELRWAVAAPRWTVSEEDRREDVSVEGELPFWCLDRTSRDLRVPFRAKRDATVHECGAVGVRAVEVAVKADVEGIGKIRRVYESFLGKGGAVDGFQWSKTSWELDVPEKVVPSSATGPSATVLTLQAEGQARDPPENPGAGIESSNSKGSVHISLVLFTAGPSRGLSGEIGPGRTLNIELVKLPA